MRMLLIAGAFALLSCSGAPLRAQIPSTSSGQAYPAKTVRYVVAFPAGDSPDIVARLVADRLSRMWEQQVVKDAGIPPLEPRQDATPA